MKQENIIVYQSREIISYDYQIRNLKHENCLPIFFWSRYSNPMSGVKTNISVQTVIMPLKSNAETMLSLGFCNLL